MTRAEINRLVRSVLDQVPDGRLAKHATPEERLAVVALVVDTLGPVLGAKARRARFPVQLAGFPGQGWPGGRRGVARRRAGDAKPGKPSDLVGNVDKRLRHWLPAGVKGLDGAIEWRKQATG